jgi:hypothetical protein
LLILFSIDAFASEQNSFSLFSKDTLGISGSARTAVFTRDKSFTSDRGYSVNSIWLQSRSKDLYGFKPFIDARVQDQNSTRLLRPITDLREGYIEASYNALDLKLGRQINVWGRADKANPTDVWTVKDFTLLSTDDEDQRTGLLATQAIWNFDGSRIIGIWQPEWRSPKLPLSPLPPGINLNYGSPRGRAGQFGIKFDRSGDFIDWSVSYSRVIDRNPDLKVINSTNAGTELEFNFQNIEVLGADFAKSIGDYGLRGEAAYTKTKDSVGLDRLTKNSFFYSVLGAERSFGDLNINLQYIYRHTFDYRSSDEVADPQMRFLAKQIEILNNQKKKNFHAGTARVNYKLFHETLETELAVVGRIDNGLIRPKITYAFNDSFKGILGAEFYRGDAETFFGRLKNVSSVFTEIRYFF